MRKLSIIIIFALLGLSATAQKLTFHSAEFEMGVKSYLGLGENDDVQQSQADTITAINLSGLGIKDIRDVIYLPHVEVLNLSNNGISDTFPLTVLDSLRLLNLCNNELGSINPLVFSNANKMQVLIAYNYISDFSFFLTPAKCQITLVGMDQQMDKSTPYFDVYQLFVDINVEGKPEVFYRGYTNMEAAANILCGEAQTAATMDGDTRSAVVPGSPTAAAMVVLTNGEQADTTWVVPPTEYELEASATLTIATGLPEDYTIASVYSKNGIEATVDGVNISYTATEDFDTDTLYISYYEGSRLRGFSEFYIVNPNAISTLLGDANNDRRVNIADITAVINKISGRQPTRFIQQNVDFNNDGKITEVDITPLINIILGKQQ